MPKKKGLESFQEVRTKIGKIAEGVQESLQDNVDEAIARKKAPEEVMQKNVASLGFELFEVILPHVIEQAKMFADPKTRVKKECEINSMSVFVGLGKLAKDVVTIFSSLIEVKEQEKRDIETAERIAYIAKKMAETPVGKEQKRREELTKLLYGSEETTN